MLIHGYFCWWKGFKICEKSIIIWLFIYSQYSISRTYWYRVHQVRRLGRLEKRWSGGSGKWFLHIHPIPLVRATHYLQMQRETRRVVMSCVLLLNVFGFQRIDLPCVPFKRDSRWQYCCAKNVRQSMIFLAVHVAWWNVLFVSCHGIYVRLSDEHYQHGRQLLDLWLVWWLVFVVVVVVMDSWNPWYDTQICLCTIPTNPWPFHPCEKSMLSVFVEH